MRDTGGAPSCLRGDKLGLSSLIGAWLDSGSGSLVISEEGEKLLASEAWSAGCTSEGDGGVGAGSRKPRHRQTDGGFVINESSVPCSAGLCQPAWQFGPLAFN